MMVNSLMVAAGILHWAVDPMSTVQRLPDVEPADGIAGGTVRIVAAGDEYEPGSFVVKGTGPTEKVTLEVSDLKREEEGGKGEGTFPREDLDLKVVKVWYQNRNAWFSYFGDCGWKLCPELLLNDEELIRVDEKTQSNYAKLDLGGGKTKERWINPPRQFNFRRGQVPWHSTEAFQPMRPDFHDAKTLQPVTLEQGRCKQFFLTAHVRKGTPAGLYRGKVEIRGEGGQVSIPVELKVLPFTLPEPRTHVDPSKEFKVSSYSYMNDGNIMLRNGFDREGARKLYGAVFRDLVAHNQRMYIINAGGEFSDELVFTLDEMKKAGMCTDELMGCVRAHGTNKDGTPDQALAKRRAAAATRIIGHRNVHLSYGDEPGPKWMIPARQVLDAYKEWGFKTFIAGSDMCFHKAGFIYDWFNIARPPTSEVTTRLWNGVNADSIAWYANQHVGAEDPSFNRRQNGMGAWLAGYTALCNYAHHFGPYDDDSTTYRPMVFAYGTGDGVIDTLQWEGFREGIDDIRYATAMTALAREATMSGRNRTEQLGRKALQLLVEFDREAGSLSALRGEMVRHILALREALGHEAVLAPKAVRKTVEPEADISAELATDLAACKNARARADVYSKYFMYEKAYGELVAANETLAVAQLCSGDRFNRPAVAEANYRKVLADPKAREGDRRDAFIAMLGFDLGFALKYEDEVLRGKTSVTNWLASVIPNGCFKKGLFLYSCKYDAAAELARLNRAACATLGKVVTFLSWDYALESRVASGDRAGAAKLAAEALASSGAANFKPEERYKLELAKRVMGGEEIPKGLCADADAKKRVDAVCALGSWVMQSGDEQTVRRLIAYRDTLFRKGERKRYTVRFSEREILSPSDWAGVEAAPMDRHYGGDKDVLYTDVATGDRGEVGSDKDGKGKAPEIAILADAWGLHFRYDSEDEKAAGIAAGLEKGYSWEGYIAPGGERAYTGIFINAGRETDASFYMTSYDNPEHRQIDLSAHPGWSRCRTVFGEGRVTTYLSVSWEAFARTLPKDGDVWEYENIRWGAGGDNAWNGTESIHGRSTWGELVFALPPKARAAILRRQIFAAKAGYEREKNPRVNGVLEFWSDPLQGDPSFYAACVKPVEEKLDSYLPQVKTDMSDDDAERLAGEALPGWLNIRHTVDRLRWEYLGSK